MRHILLLSAVTFNVLLSAPLMAHPHVFIDTKVNFVADDAGALTALEITWVYDVFTSLTLISLLDLDQDNDGVLSQPNLERVVKAQTIWPDEFQGDTYLETVEGPVPLGRPLNGAAAEDNGQISVSFLLPLIEPIVATDPLELRLYDPSYYYAYSTLEVSAPSRCDVALSRFEPNTATSALRSQLARLSKEETPEQKDVGRLFADVMVLTCA